jgi:hypothetical protein
LHIFGTYTMYNKVAGLAMETPFCLNENEEQMIQPNVSLIEAPNGCADTFRPLTWRGFAWAAALPACGTLLFYGLVLHARFTLGHWPNFGEKPPTQLFSFHLKCTKDFVWVLFFSLYLVPFLAIGSLCLRRWRHISVYAVAYAVFVAFAAASVLLAPHSFLNWFFD